MGGSHIIMGQSDEELAALQDSEGWIKQLIHRPLFGEAKQIDVPTAEGSHGGGDRALFRDIYDRTAEPDRHGRGAGCEQGAASMLVGDVVNLSLTTGKAVQISESCPLRPSAQRLHELTA
jgi:hypothetical protein